VNKEKSFIESPLDDWLMFVDGQYGTSVRITSLNLQKREKTLFFCHHWQVKISWRVLP
jgi:hypothetical protein